MDTAIANEISRLAIDERLTYFREHPGYTADFYLHKHLSQWADGTYASRQATLATYGGRSAFFKEVYEGSLSGGYIEWCNAWQNVLYLGVLVFCIGSLKKRRKSKVVGHMDGRTADRLGADRLGTDRLYVYVGLIAVLGGFLFHTFWEANSRYIFSYSLLLMPYCGAGIYTGICRIRDGVRSRFH